LLTASNPANVHDGRSNLTPPGSECNPSCGTAPGEGLGGLTPWAQTW
jgi:hypothetical protein